MRMLVLAAVLAMGAAAPPRRTPEQMEQGKEFNKLNKEVAALRKAGKSAEALALAEKGLALLMRLHGPYTRMTAQWANALAAMRGRAGQHAQAAEAWHIEARAWERLLGER